MLYENSKTASQAWEAGSIPVSRSTSKGVENQLVMIFSTFVISTSAYANSSIFTNFVVVLRAIECFCCE